jgi:hypothetical protein
MIPQFDLFHIADGNPIWVGTASTLDEARLQVGALLARQPGEYLIVSLQTGHKELVMDGATNAPPPPPQALLTLSL